MKNLKAMEVQESPGDLGARGWCELDDKLLPSKGRKEKKPKNKKDKVVSI